jgi:hypothetical protein
LFRRKISRVVYGAVKRLMKIKGRFNVLPKFKPEEKDVETPSVCLISRVHAVNDAAICNRFMTLPEHKKA